jgi:hypothetical protein
LQDEQLKEWRAKDFGSIVASSPPLRGVRELASWRAGLIQSSLIPLWAGNIGEAKNVPRGTLHIAD